MDQFNNGGQEQNMDIGESETNGVKKEGKERRFPWKTADGGVRKKRKKTPAERNMHIKKYVQPKNAIMCLNELVQGVVYQTENESTDCTTPMCVSVTVNGQKYRGFGSSKQMARQAAAEAALVSFVKPPTGTEGGEDNTPWTVLASFAMYKLFNEWREGRIGMCHPGFGGTNPFGIPMVQDATMSQSLQTMMGGAANLQNMMTAGMTQAMPAVTDKAQMSNIFSAYLVGSKEVKKDEAFKQVPNPAKTVPENANAMHPVMLLHQMRPQLAYTQTSTTVNGQPVFTLSCEIDGQTFTGDGSNLKKAKLNLAIKANKTLFNIDSTYQ